MLPSRGRDVVQAELAAIVESSDDAIIGKDMDGIITSWNKGAERIYGYSASEIIGKPVSILMAPEVADDFPNIMDRLKRGERVDHYETIRITKHGRRLRVSLTVSPIRSRDGTIVGASAVVRDVTERKLLDEALMRSEKLASAGRIAATIAHEINNPLEAVVNLLYLALSDRALSRSTRSYLETAESELSRVSHIVRQTLTFYKEVGTAKPLNMASLVSTVVALLRERIQQKHITVDTQFRVADGSVFGVEGDLRQILLNLLTNSVDAVGTGGRVLVRIAVAPEWRGAGRKGLRITVADDGNGIELEHRQHLFKPFYTTKTSLGTGLGLWVTQQIVQKNGGKIRVRSSTSFPKTWSAFSVFVPLATAQEENKRAAA